MENQCCATCKYGHCENGECVCVTDSDYISHDVGQENKCDDYASRDRLAYIRKIASELRRELLSDKELYNALVASIYSAIYGNGAVCNIPNQHELAEFIAKRVVGKD